MHDTYKDIEMIEAEFGTPFYILKLDRFRRNFNEFLASFRDIYANTKIAYSYKTNYTPQLCQAVNEIGGWAEVVSGMEYELAVRVGVEPTNIVFNGPYKSFEDIENALIAGSMVNLDSFYELDILQKIAAAHNQKQFGIGLRVNFRLEEDVEFSRFGFNVENGSLAKAIDQIKRLDNVHISGLHCHFMIPNKKAAGYRNIAKKMLELYGAYFESEGLRYIDIGGGFFSRMPPELARQFAGPVASFEDYARAIATEFAEFFADVERKPLLVLEPGVALTADVMDFIAKVIDIKQLAERNLVLVNGSIYDIKPTLNKKNLPMEIIPKGTKDQSVMGFDIVGYTCMEGDYLARGAKGVISRGDYVIFRNTGAYTVVLKPPFIRLAPPILTFVDGKVELIRRADRLEDVFGGYGVF